MQDIAVESQAVEIYLAISGKGMLHDIISLAYTSVFFQYFIFALELVSQCGPVRSI